MSAFRSLFRTPRPMIDGRLAPDLRSQMFPEALRHSHRLHLWKPNTSFAQSGLRLLIGVATWSGPDMALLDAIEEAALDSTKAAVRVDVIDVNDLKNPRDVESVFPGLTHATQTPFLGIWRDGELQEVHAGHQAREILTFIFGIDPLSLQLRAS